MADLKIIIYVLATLFNIAFGLYNYWSYKGKLAADLKKSVLDTEINEENDLKWFGLIDLIISNEGRKQMTIKSISLQVKDNKYDLLGKELIQVDVGVSLYKELKFQIGLDDFNLLLENKSELIIIDNTNKKEVIDLDMNMPEIFGGENDI